MIKSRSACKQTLNQIKYHVCINKKTVPTHQKRTHGTAGYSIHTRKKHRPVRSTRKATFSTVNSFMYRPAAPFTPLLFAI